MNAMSVTILETAPVPVGDLSPHPENPNRGDVNAIAESLEDKGQYRPIVVSKDNVILAGHHVWQAAKNIGWKEILVSRLSVNGDSEEARRVLVSDNRLADLGMGPDPEKLLAVLEGLDDLVGTGFDDEYVRMLNETVAGAPDLDDLDDKHGGEGGGNDDDYHSRVTLVLDPDVAKQWEAWREGYDDDTEALSWLFSQATPADETITIKSDS